MRRLKICITHGVSSENMQVILNALFVSIEFRTISAGY